MTQKSPPQNSVILPGGTIGMIGGGQLGRMFAFAASAMGYKVVVLAEADDLPAAQVAHGVVVGKLDDPQAIDKFAKQCDVITLEFENVPAKTLRQCSHHAPTFPPQRVLEISQDRVIEKSTLQNAGLSVTPFVGVEDRETLLKAGENLGWPLVVKTTRDGYDGKGQYKIESSDQVDQIHWDASAGWIAEKWIQYSKEVSVVVAISSNGESSSFPVFENQHRHHILDITTVPAEISPRLADQARMLAIQAAETLGVVGLLCVEFFVVDDELLINEVAPRPHNSGHLTIEASHTSQYQQHVRAICGLPLGSTEMKCGAAAMVNLLGDLWPDSGVPAWNSVLMMPEAQLHLYGKSSAKPGRKMGHLTVTGNDLALVRHAAIEARNRLA